MQILAPSAARHHRTAHRRADYYMRLSYRFCLFLLALDATANLWGQTAATNQPPKTAGFTFPYKKGDRLVARFTGSDSQLLSAALTLYQVRDFRVESFNSDGTPNLIGEAPQCQLNVATKSVSSSGPLTVSQVGGLFSLSGEGFEWNHESGQLVLSNRVRTVIRLNLLATRPGTRLLP
jgi:lipopolysaccharide export system protein LptC